MRPFEVRLRAKLARVGLLPTRRIYLATGAGLAAVTFLLIPGNPVWDWSRTRVPNGVALLLLFGLLMVAAYLDRRSMLSRIARARPWLVFALAAAAPVAAVAVMAFLYSVLPRYLASVNREWGLVEPVTLFCYFLALLFGAEHARALRRAGEVRPWPLEVARGPRRSGGEHRPYVLLAVFYAVLLLEECDWLGVFGAVIGRIEAGGEGVYVGSLHDLGHLWYESSYKLAGLKLLAVAAVVSGVALWRTGFLTWRFVRREAFALSTLLILAGLALAGLAGVYDVTDEYFPQFPRDANFPEEPLELLCSVLVLTAAALKFRRDARAGRISVWG
jgi:hypothetical protein